MCVSICVCAKCVGAGNQTLVFAKIENVLNHWTVSPGPKNFFIQSILSTIFLQLLPRSPSLTHSTWCSLSSCLLKEKKNHLPEQKLKQTNKQKTNKMRSNKQTNKNHPPPTHKTKPHGVSFVLDVGTALRYGWYTQWHATGESWHSLYQWVSIAKGFLTGGGAACLLSPSYWNLVCLEPTQARWCCHSLCDLIWASEHHQACGIRNLLSLELPTTSGS